MKDKIKYIISRSVILSGICIYINYQYRKLESIYEGSCSNYIYKIDEPYILQQIQSYMQEYETICVSGDDPLKDDLVAVMVLVFKSNVSYIIGTG